MIRNVVIIGSGPAGCTAGIYTARAMLSPLIISGLIPGGQLTLSIKVENFPGFPGGISGIELMNKLKLQAQEFGTEFIDGEVSKVDFLSFPFKIFLNDDIIETKSVIIATGSSPRKLKIPSEEKFIGKGVSYCAICDGFFFKDKKVIVVGGGDSAFEDALFLTKYAKLVQIVHRRDKFRASYILQKRVKENKKIDIIPNNILVEIIGDKFVKSVKLKNVISNEVKEIECDGVFVAIGYEPNTKIFIGQIELTENGYIKTNNTRTNINGVFACGDVQDPYYRQAITAAASGCIAAREVEKYLANLQI
jgi:thioredoxin reductase (NADPH)